MLSFVYTDPIARQIDLRHINQPDVSSTPLTNSSSKIESGIDLTDFLLNVEWDVMDVPATRRERTYECCVGAFQGELADLRHHIGVS